MRKGCVGDAVVRGGLHSLTPQHDSFFHDPSIPCPFTTPLTTHSFPLTVHLLHSPIFQFFFSVAPALFQSTSCLFSFHFLRLKLLNYLLITSLYDSPWKTVVCSGHALSSFIMGSASSSLEMSSPPPSSSRISTKLGRLSGPTMDKMLSSWIASAFT